MSRVTVEAAQSSAAADAEEVDAKQHRHRMQVKFTAQKLIETPSISLTKLVQLLRRNSGEASPRWRCSTVEEVGCSSQSQVC